MTGRAQWAMDLMRVIDGQPLDVPTLDADYWLRCGYATIRALPQPDPDWQPHPLGDLLAAKYGPDLDVWAELATQTERRRAA